MQAMTRESTSWRRPPLGGAAWILGVGFLLSAVALAFGAWFMWKVVAFFSICTEHPEYI